MNYRSVSDLNAAVVRNLSRLPRDVEVVVGIPRSGLLAASLVALYLNKPLADIEGFLQGRLLRAGNRLDGRVNEKLDPQTSRALVVDDSIQSGREIARVREKMALAGAHEFVRFFCIFAHTPCVSMVDYYAEICPVPRVFEWNVMHHPHLEYSCVDIDGVLCRDPTTEENDDGPAYERFLQTVEPRCIPTVTLGWLVTSRLEKYRTLTVDWLARHGFRYRELIMMQHPDKAARVAAGEHATYKAGTYVKTRAILFIESSPEQALEIARISGRAVFCAENREMINPGSAVVSCDLPGKPTLSGSPGLSAMKKEISRFVSPEEPFILVDEDQFRWSMPDYRAIPFLEEHGEYWGPPPDDQAAIHHIRLDRLAGGVQNPFTTGGVPDDQHRFLVIDIKRCHSLRQLFQPVDDSLWVPRFLQP